MKTNNEDCVDYIEEATIENHDDPCPKCGTQLKAKWSGVECPNPECDYWFCL